MKIAVVGSRGLLVSGLEKYLPKDTDEIVSGGAKGIDSCAKRYALEHGIKLTEFLPDYERYGIRAPLVRNERIVEYSDEVIAFWDGKSRGTMHVIRVCRECGKKVTVYAETKN